MNTIEKIKFELGSLTGKISSEDKLLAALELGVHVETVNRYMRGEVRKESFGLDLLECLRNKVEKREKVLEK